MADSAVHGHRRTKHHRLEVLDLGGNAGDRELPVLAHAFRRLLLWLSNPLFHFLSREVFLIRSIHLAATDYPTRKHSDEATSYNGSQIRTETRSLQRHGLCRDNAVTMRIRLQRESIRWCSFLPTQECASLDKCLLDRLFFESRKSPNDGIVRAIAVPPAAPSPAFLDAVQHHQTRPRSMASR